MTPQTSGKPMTRAVVGGAVSGAMTFAVLVLVDHFVFSSRETARFGLTMALVGAVVAGGIFGAIVGMVMAMTRSMPAAIAAGAVLIAILKLFAVGSAGPISVFAVIVGLLYGAAFGWAAASSAAKAMDASE